MVAKAWLKWLCLCEMYAGIRGRSLRMGGVLHAYIVGNIPMGRNYLGANNKVGWDTEYGENDKQKRQSKRAYIPLKL